MTTYKSRSARKQKKAKQKKPLWRKIIKTSFLICFIIGLLGLGVFGYFIATAPKLDVDKLDVAYASNFYDQDGEVFAELFDENRTKIEYDDIPDVLIDAVTATEDSRFFKHPGIDVRRIGGAIKANFTRGFGSEGASTITQQVVENMFLTPEKSIKLKVQEQWLALKLEREYSKEQIMEMYLNKIFYGSNAYGVAKASEVYFGKEDLHDLTLLEAAMLAGLPQRPTAYNPFENPDLMKERVDTVLNLMVRHDKITQEEADEAKQIEIESVLTDKKPKSVPHDAFVKKALDELDEKLDGIDIHTAGLKIHTTLDKDAQEHVEFLLTDSDDNPISYPDEELLAGMTIVDTKTGAIQAVGGSRNPEEDTTFGSNYALEANRQPGSTMKPIVAYGPAIETQKWSTYHQINDDKPFQSGTSTPIRNWNRDYQGWMSIRYALEQSLNVPAVKTFEEIGSDAAKPFAESLGIVFADERLDPRDVIGGTKTNVSPLQLAGAFSAFGNEGIYTEPYAVTKVEFPDGSVVDLTPESEAVMSDYTAYMVTDMLKGVVTNGTGTQANIPDLPIAGKTGTTNTSEKPGANNSWFVGYSTNYSIAVWTGYKEHEKIIENTKIPHALFKETMQEISKDIETPDFTKPDSVVEVQVEKGSNPPALPSPLTSSDNIVTELFVKGTEPTTVSDKFDELNPVSNLTASYNDDKESIDVSWEYDDELDVSYEVQYKVDDGEYKSLGTTEDKEIDISSVDEGSTYTIQVVAISNEDNSLKSAAETVTVDVADEEEDEDIPAVTGLQATYNDSKNALDVSWQYNGPEAEFEININGDKQMVKAQNLQVNGVTPGRTYRIIVTPIIDDQRGPTSETSITIEEQNNDEDQDPDTDTDTDSDSNQNSDQDEDKPEVEEPNEDVPNEEETNEDTEEAA